MSGSIFKVPPLPEDSMMKKKKFGSFLKPNYFNGNWNENKIECRKSFQTTSINYMGVKQFNDFQPLKETVHEDAMIASTSQQKNILNPSTSFCALQRHPGYEFPSKMDFGLNCNSFVDITRIEKNSSSAFANVNSQNFPHSLRNGGFNSNSGAKSWKSSDNTFKRCESVSSFYINPRVKEISPPLYMKQERYGNYSMNSSLKKQDSVFAPSFLSSNQENRISQDRTNFRSINATSSINFSRDVSLSLNAHQDRKSNQTVIKSFLDATSIAIKEQILNLLEKFGHTALSNAVGSKASAVQFAFDKALKEMNQIFDSSMMCVSSIKDIGEMPSTLSYGQGSCGGQRKAVQYQEQNKGRCEPSYILRGLEKNENELLSMRPKLQCSEIVTVKKKKTNDPLDDSVHFESDFESSPSPTVKRMKKNKDMNLKNWYPKAVKGGLVIVGTNDENVVCETAAVKKRISEHRVLLTNGFYCNLVGSPSSDQKFPSNIFKKIERGLTFFWKKLLSEIQSLEKNSRAKTEDVWQTDTPSTTKKKKLVKVSDKKNSMKFNTSMTPKKAKSTRTITKSPFIRRTDKLNKVESPNFKGNQQPKKNDSFTEAEKGITIFKVRSFAKNKSKVQTTLKKKRRDENRKEPNNITEVTKPKISPLKKKLGYESRIHKDPTESSDILHVTRSGRAVRRPGGLWIGSDINESTEKVDLKQKLQFSGSNTATKRNSMELKRKRKVKECASDAMEISKSEKSSEELELRYQSKKFKSAKKTPQKKERKKSLASMKSQTAQKLPKVGRSAAAKKTDGEKLHELNGSFTEGKTILEKSCEYSKAISKQSLFKTVETNSFRTSKVNDWENELEGLNDIMIPEMSNRAEEAVLDRKNFNMISAETPPLKIFRSNLQILKNCTPVQSPTWHLSHHSHSEVKKFEKIRAQTFKQKIPQEIVKKKVQKVKIGPKNKDVETVIHWINQKEVKSPKLGSKVVDYIISKRSDLDMAGESEEDEEI